MKKNIFFKVFLSLSLFNTLNPANAQYFKPSIVGSWLYKNEFNINESKSSKDKKVFACKVKLFW